MKLWNVAIPSFIEIRPRVKRKQPFPLTRTLAPILPLRGGLSDQTEGGTMSFESTPNAQQGALFDAATLPTADRQARRYRMLPLGAIIGAAQASHQLGGEAPWPVWHGSTRKPVQFQPMPKRQAVRIWHDARRLERRTRKPGHQDGAIGRNGLAVLHAFLFDFINRATGELTPTRATIARAACISISSVDRGLAKLKAAGVINWLRQCAESIENGVYGLRQIASAYFVLAQSQWRGFWQPPASPPPDPEAWGQTPPLPSPIEMAAQLQAEGGSHAAQLDALTCDPRDGVANGMAGLFSAIIARKG
jgi:hypothetical protein